MIGIYKITSPTNKIYIGQSIDIEKRFLTYKLLRCKTQPALYLSFIKHNVENHIFEILEQCSIELLNERERYYQDFYNVLSLGLNCKLTNTNDKNGCHNEITKNKIRNSLLGKKRDKSIGIKTGLKLKGIKRSRESVEKSILNRKGYTHTKETRKKISESNKNKVHKKGVEHYNYGKKLSEEQKEKIRITSRLKVIPKEVRQKISLNSPFKKNVLDTETGIFYYSIKEVEIAFNLNHLGRYLNGTRKNKTKFILI